MGLLLMRTFTKTIITLSLLSVTSAYAATQTANGGVVHFKGEIVNAACAVSAESDGQIVKLGQYRTAQFKAVGDKTGTVPFDIKLIDCDTTVATNASVAFKGVADSTDPSVLQISNIGGGASGSSAGVGIEIADHKGVILTPDASVYSTKSILKDGDNTLNFTARYKSTKELVTAGKADADATFTMKYE